MVHNELFQQCIAKIPAKEKEQFERNFNIAEQLCHTLKGRGISLLAFARMTGRKESEIKELLTGRCTFDPSTVQQFESILQCKI